MFKNLLIIVCCFLLTHCATVSDTHLQVNQQLASPYTLPAATYLAQSKNKTGEEKQSLRLMAAGRLIHDGQWRQGQMILSRLKSTSPILNDKKKLLLAKIELIRERPKLTIKHLAKVQDISTLSIYYQAQYYEMLAQAYKDTGNAAESISERIKLGRLLPDSASKANNHRVLWLTLTRLSLADLNAMAIEAEEDSELKGWASLAVISNQNYDHPQAMLAAVESWQKTYKNHAANSLLNPAGVSQLLFPQPEKIALLLPLTGSLAGPGHAIKDGFLGAYRGSKQAGQIKVQYYNTNEAEAGALYNQAVHDGADYIVGPLSKANVSKVAAVKRPVPTLLLNDINTYSKNNTYQFGLSPDNEARQVASKARRNGYTRALVIAPENAWGREVVAAFTQQWHANGGQIVDTLDYKSDENLNNALRDFLHITASETRKKELRQVLRRPVESTPRRRQDFDMIFLLAYPSKARQIMPLLRYYYAGDVPVYATSSVYSGSPNSMKDRDLNGIIFCDMPWVFNHNLGDKNWPEQLNSYNRLYALGMDSYALSSQLNQLLLFPAMGVHDKSGVLYLNPNGQVARILAWGTFEQGRAKLLNEKIQ